MTQGKRQLPMLQGPEKAACGVAIATAAGAVLCGVCCVLPFALPAVALASSGTAIAWLASGYSWATTIAVAIVGAAWLWIAVRSIRAQARPSSSTFYAMGLATVVLGLAAVWPRIEPVLIALLKAQGQAAPGTAPATAQGPNARQATTPQVTVELIAGAPNVPTTSDLWVGLRFRLQEGWHIYWRNPGDSGGPPTVTWQLPEGVTADDVVWPMPSRLPLGPLMNYGYEGDVVLPVRLKLQTRARSESSFPIRADLKWLVCREVCLSGKGTLQLQLPLSGPIELTRATGRDASRRLEPPSHSRRRRPGARWRDRRRSISC